MLEYPIYKKKSLILLFLLPTILILLVFLYYPLWQMVITSFYKNNFVLGTRKFTGWSNFIQLFTPPFSASYLQVVLQTILFVVAIEFLLISTSLVIAHLLTLKIKGLTPYKYLLILTFALSPPVAGLLFTFLFNVEFGLVNQILQALFNVKLNWIHDGYLAIIVTILGMVWKYMGYNIVFYLAAFQNIPKEFNEAAEIDGATEIQKFFNISVPMVSPTTFFLVFTNLAFVIFNSFGFIEIVTAGGPVGKGLLNNTGVTTTLMLKIYQDGFTGSGNLGLAAAQSILLFILIMGITFIKFQVGRNKIQYGENS